MNKRLAIAGDVSMKQTQSECICIKYVFNYIAMAMEASLAHQELLTDYWETWDIGLVVRYQQ